MTYFSQLRLRNQRLKAIIQRDYSRYQKSWSPFCEIKDKKQSSVPVRT